MPHGRRFLALLALLAPHAAWAAAGACPPEIGATPVPLSPRFVARFNQTFGLDLPPREAEAIGRVRCDGATVLACNIGANLPCGLADTRRRNPGADAWCAQNPGSSFIPAYVTSHATIFDWRCVGSKAVAEKQIHRVDSAGYVAEYWRPLR